MIANRMVRGAVSILGAVLIDLLAIALVGFVLPGFALHLIYPDDDGGGPPGLGLMLLAITAFSALISILPLLGLTVYFYGKLSRDKVGATVSDRESGL